MASSSPLPDFYSKEMLHEIWQPGWFEGMFRNGKWFEDQDTLMDSIDVNYQIYHPYSCKRGALTNTKLSTCSACKVIKYCCVEHQKADRKHHKKWCKAFAQLRSAQSMDFASRREWFEAINEVYAALSLYMALEPNTDNLQYVTAQPRCRKCFKAECCNPGLSLQICKICGGVALCKECRESGTEFHFDAENPSDECGVHRLALCCTGMIVEQGNPLSIPCDTETSQYWNPSDWRDFFAMKRQDFGLLPRILVMAPVNCIITDSLSTCMTIQHILSLPESGISGPERLEELVVHICGAAGGEITGAGKYVQITKINPQLKRVVFRLIGPQADERFTDISRQVIALTGVRDSCDVEFHLHQKAYHEAIQEFGEEKPDIVFCPNSGLSDVSYSQLWRPTLELLRDRKSLCVFTGYDHQEVLNDTERLEALGLRVVVPPKHNPFCSLRPFLDPQRSPAEAIYGNQSYVVTKGAA